MREEERREVDYREVCESNREEEGLEQKANMVCTEAWERKWGGRRWRRRGEAPGQFSSCSHGRIYGWLIMELNLNFKFMHGSWK